MGLGGATGGLGATRTSLTLLGWPTKVSCLINLDDSTLSSLDV